VKRIITLLFAFAISCAVINRPYSSSAAQAPQAAFDKFFSDFTAEWMRGNPNAATATRYFTADEQDRLERQLTPETDAYRRARINLARKGLAELRKFDAEP
jgi:hypothetical protein